MAIRFCTLSALLNISGSLFHFECRTWSKYLLGTYLKLFEPYHVKSTLIMMGRIFNIYSSIDICKSPTLTGKEHNCYIFIIFL